MNILDVLSQLQNGQSQQNDQGNDDDFVMPQQVQDDSSAYKRRGNRKEARQFQKQIEEELPAAQEQMRQGYWDDINKFGVDDHFRGVYPKNQTNSIAREEAFIDKYGKRNLPVDLQDRTMENFEGYKFGQTDPGAEHPSDKDYRYLDNEQSGANSPGHFADKFGYSRQDYRREDPNFVPLPPRPFNKPLLSPEVQELMADPTQTDIGAELKQKERLGKRQRGEKLTDEEMQEELQYNMDKLDHGGDDMENIMRRGQRRLKPQDI